MKTHLLLIVILLLFISWCSENISINTNKTEELKNTIEDTIPNKVEYDNSIEKKLIEETEERQKKIVYYKKFYYEKTDDKDITHLFVNWKEISSTKKGANFKDEFYLYEDEDSKYLIIDWKVIAEWNDIIIKDDKYTIFENIDWISVILNEDKEIIWAWQKIRYYFNWMYSQYLETTKMFYLKKNGRLIEKWKEINLINWKIIWIKNDTMSYFINSKWKPECIWDYSIDEQWYNECKKNFYE